MRRASPGTHSSPQRRGGRGGAAQGTYQQGYGAVLDSGTTFTYLPSAAFAPFRAAVQAHALARGLQLTSGPDKNVPPPLPPTHTLSDTLAQVTQLACKW